jgi:ribonucleoside-diphosphate reductase alpha chain
MPSNATYNDIDRAYRLAWSIGLKSITVYRDQSKLSQPLSSFSSSGNDDDISQSIINSRTKGFASGKDDEYIEALNAIIDGLEKENDELRKKIKGNKFARKPLPSRRNGHIQKTKIGVILFSCILENMKMVNLEKYLLICTVKGLLLEVF